MLSGLKKLIAELPKLARLDRRLDEVKINQGRILCELNSRKTSTDIRDYEFKVFSQWGEDGILQFLVSKLDIANRTFVEFGVEDFSESNCRFLLVKSGWHGYVIDGSESNMRRLQAAYYYWQHDIRSKASFVTAQNIDALLTQSGFDKRLGVLSIDVDGVDYHILEALPEWTPSILIVEYNATFGYERAVTVPYDPAFVRGKKHYSNQYWGASLPAFAYLANQRGYAFVGTNSTAVNAFFVRRELLNGFVKEADLAAFAVPAGFKDSRTQSGSLSFLGPKERRDIIADLPLLDVQTGATLRVGDLP